MSLLIPNREIYNLYYDNNKVKYAYFNGQKVWVGKHKVQWFGNSSYLIKLDWVAEGDSATPPRIVEFSDGFYNYNILGWDTDYNNITEDTNITAVTSFEMYLFKHGYGVNFERFESGFSETCTAYDEVSDLSYTSVKKGDINDSSIICSNAGGNDSDYSNFRSMTYEAILLNMDELSANGFTKVNFNGMYDFSSGTVYRSQNLRSSFVSLQKTNKVITFTDSGIYSSLAWEYNLNLDMDESKNTYISVPAVSGSISSSINLPTTGNYYLIVGGLSKAFEGTVTTTINNIWFE